MFNQRYSQLAKQIASTNRTVAAIAGLGINLFFIVQKIHANDIRRHHQFADLWPQCAEVIRHKMGIDRRRHCLNTMTKLILNGVVETKRAAQQSHKNC